MKISVLFLLVLPCMVSGFGWRMVSSSNGYPALRNILTHSSSRHGSTGVCKFKHPGASFWRSGRIIGDRCYIKYIVTEDDGRVIENNVDKALPFEVMGYEPLADKLEWAGRSIQAIDDRGVRVHEPDQFPTYVCAHPEHGVGALNNLEPLVQPNVCWVNGHSELCRHDKCPVLVNTLGVAYSGERLRYFLEDIETTDRAPNYGTADVFRNVNGQNPIIATLRASVESTAESSWEMNEFFNAKTEMTMKAGVPLFWQGKWFISAEYEYETAYSEKYKNVTRTESEIQVSVDPGFECYLVSIHSMATVNVPYEAQMTTRYQDGSYRGPETVRGMYYGLPVKESYTEFGCCPLVGGQPDCSRKETPEVLSEYSWTTTYSKV